TDGYRLAIRRKVFESAQAQEVQILIPADHLMYLAKLAGEAAADEPVGVAIAPNLSQVVFSINQARGEDGGRYIELVSEILDAKYPPYEGIIPKEHSTRATVEVATLMKSLRVAQLFARDNAYIVWLYFSPEDGQ